MPALLLAGGFAVAQRDGFCQNESRIAALTGRPIREVVFSPPVTLDEQDLLKSQPLQAGELLRAAGAARAIDMLYATGRFEDIAVEIEPQGTGVRVRFVTKPAWFVGGVTVEGKIVTPPNRGQLANSTQLLLGTAFREEEIDTAVDSMKKLLAANGLYEATVTPEVTRDSDAQQVFLSFQVKQDKRAKYEDPETQGGGSLLSDDTILRVTGWRIPIIHWWRQVTDARTRKGVQAILAKYQSKQRLTAKVELEKMDYDAEKRRVRPYLQLEPGPRVEVKAKGAKVSGRVMKRYVPIYQEKAAYTDLLVEGKRNLQDYFQSRGYYDVNVEFRVSPAENDLKTIDYVITQGQRYKLSHLTISGNRYFDTGVIRERMFMTPASFNLRRGRYSEAFRKKDEENIANLYRSNGFHDVVVTSTVDKNYRGKANQMAVTVTIDEGTQWLMDSVSLRGVSQLPESALVSKLSSSAGQPFAEVSLVRDRSTVLTSYFAHGFPAAQMQAGWTLSGTPHHVNVVYTVQEGEPQYVRDVVLSGLRTTRKGLVTKQVTLKPGDPLSPTEQTDIQKRLYDLGVFARVDTAIQNPDGATQHKYVLYNFEEANRYNVAFGVGLQAGRFGTPSSTSVSAPGGQSGFSPLLSVDVSRLNFLGRGHTASLKGLYSRIEQRAAISYLQPRFQNVEGRNITYSLLYDNALNVRTFASKRQEASVQISQHFSRSLTGLFRIAYRRVSVTDVIIPVLLVPQLVQPVRLGIFSANFSQDRRDNPSDPHRGIFNTLDLGIATKYLGSQRSFGRALVRNATYYRLTKTVVLARQTQFGIIRPFSAAAGLSEQESVPLPERFFGGGADSLRAFSYNQAGPRDTGVPLVAGGMASPPTGFPLGGNALFFNNVELRFPLWGENIGGVVFHDMGNVFTSLRDISFRYRQRDLQDFNYMVHAAGIGVRYKTPVGPVRLDLAYSLNPPSFLGFSGTPEQLLSCGSGTTAPGCTPTHQNLGHFQFFFSIGQAF